MKKPIKSFIISLLAVGITVFIAAIIIYITSDQTTNDFNCFYKQYHQTLNEISRESMSSGDMAGVVIAEIGISLSVSLDLMFSNFIIILFSIVLICFGSLLWHSSKPIKGFAITTTILSIALLTSFFVLQWTDDIFLQYVNYLLVTPSLVNTITAIIIIVVPLLVLMMLAESIRMLILLKRKA